PGQGHGDELEPGRAAARLPAAQEAVRLDPGHEADAEGGGVHAPSLEPRSCAVALTRWSRTHAATPALAVRVGTGIGCPERDRPSRCGPRRARERGERPMDSASPSPMPDAPSRCSALPRA